MVQLEDGWQEGRIFLHFEGAGQESKVFVNGFLIGTHSDGYNGFRFDVTKYLEKDDSSFELAVRVDNSYNENIPPLSADFTFFGGIYRDVSVIYAPKIHFSLDHFGGPGIYWQTPFVSADSARVKIFGFITNQLDQKASVLIEHLLIDHNGATAGRVRYTQKIGEGINRTLYPANMNIASPVLWSPDAPVNYSIIWILNDFSSEGRGDAVPHINNKGVCSLDRVPKESFWFYKSIWNESPFIKIWTPFPGVVIQDGVAKAQPVRIYTNLEKVALNLNGSFIGEYRSDNEMIEMPLSLKNQNCGYLTSLMSPDVGDIPEARLIQLNQGME